MSGKNLKRLNMERKQLGGVNFEEVHYWAAPIKEDNLYLWQAKVAGPKGTCFEGGVFNLEIAFPAEYPFKPPKLTFKTKIYHPNIDENGEICLGLLKEQWKPGVTTEKVLLSVLALLAEPNPETPLVVEIGRVFKEDRATFEATAAEWVHKFASSA